MRGAGFADRANRPVGGDPFARGMGEQGGELDLPARLVDRGGLDRGDLMLAEDLADDIKAVGERGVTEAPVRSRGNGERRVAVRVFSGLVSSLCALASAAAIAPMVSLVRGMAGLQGFQGLETDGAGLRALGLQTVPSGLPGVLRHQFFQLGLGRLVLLVGRAGLEVDWPPVPPSYWSRSCRRS